MKKPTHQAATLARFVALRHTIRLAAAWILLGCCSAILAADSEQPDLEFLEYLGLWDESDEDWVVISESVGAQAATDEKRIDPASKDEESAEKKDES